MRHKMHALYAGGPLTSSLHAAASLVAAAAEAAARAAAELAAAPAAAAEAASARAAAERGAAEQRGAAERAAAAAETYQQELEGTALPARLVSTCCAHAAKAAEMCSLRDLLAVQMCMVSAVGLGPCM